MHSLFSFGTYLVFEEAVPILTRSLTVTVFTASTAWEKEISVRSFLFNLFWWICCFALWPIRLLLLLVSCVGSSCSVSYADWGRTARNHFETQAAPNKKRSYEQVHSMTSLALLAEFGKKWEDPVRRIWPVFFGHAALQNCSLKKMFVKIRSFPVLENPLLTKNPTFLFSRDDSSLWACHHSHFFRSFPVWKFTCLRHMFLKHSTLSGGNRCISS